MPALPPELAGVARSLAARLRLDESLGVSHFAGEVLVPETLARLLAPASAAWPGETAESAAPAATVTAPVSPRPKVETVLPRTRAESPSSLRGLHDAPPADTGAPEKLAAMAEVRGPAEACRLCPLCETRHRVAFGEGNLDTDLVFVGEAPGRDEDEQGRPFVGRAGKLLTAMIEKGLGRPRESVYICNIIKCRPPGNRDPLPNEVGACLPYLQRQIEIIRPKVIMTLGLPATSTLTGLQLSMTNLRGRWHEYAGIPLMATYHPAYLLRVREREGRGNPADQKAWEDLLAVARRLKAD